MNKVELHEEFRQELADEPDVIPKLLQRVRSLQEKGKGLSPPYTKRMDVPQGTPSLMNLRFDTESGPWRVPYCLVDLEGDEYFLLLAIGNKHGTERGRKSRRFYEGLVHRAQKRLEATPATAVWP